MKICFVSQEYPPDTAKGGIGTQAFAKAHGLAKRGHEVYVISRQGVGAPGNRPLPESCYNESVHITRLSGSSMGVFTEAADWLTYSAVVAEAVAALHERVGLDLVEFPEWGCEGYVHLLNQTEWNHVPSIIHLHGPLAMLAEALGWPTKGSDFYKIGTHMEATCLRLADRVYSSSACSANWVANRYDLRELEIPVMHTGVDTKTFYPRNVPKEDRPTIIFAGKVARNKGVGVLLQAVLSLMPEFPRLRLRVLGRGEKEVAAELRSAAVAASCAEALELAGFVDRQDLPDHLSRAHIFAAPSRYEGGPGFVYLEAMSCGLPVIACAGSGAAEVIEDGETGFLVPPDDVTALAAALRKLISEPMRAKAMGESGRQYVLEHADGDLCLCRLEAFYIAVMVCGSGPRTADPAQPDPSEMGR